MSSARITIGGLDVSRYSGELVAGAQPAAESQGVPPALSERMMATMSP